MRIKSPFIAAIGIVATTLALSVVVPLLVVEGQAGWGEEGGMMLSVGLLSALIAVAFALLREIQSRAGTCRVPPEKQGELWLQNHLLECTATLDTVGHESAMPHLLARETDRLA